MHELLLGCLAEPEVVEELGRECQDDNLGGMQRANAVYCGAYQSGTYSGGTVLFIDGQGPYFHERLSWRSDFRKDVPGNGTGDLAADITHEGSIYVLDNLTDGPWEQVVRVFLHEVEYGLRIFESCRPHSNGMFALLHFSCGLYSHEFRGTSEKAFFSLEIEGNSIHS